MSRLVAPGFAQSRLTLSWTSRFPRARNLIVPVPRKPTPVGTLLFALSSIVICWTNAGAQNPPPCAAAEPVKSLTAQAQDQNRLIEDRVKAYASAIRSCPKEGALYEGIVLLLLQHQDSSTALDWALRGMKADPADADLRADAGAAQLALGYPETALSTLRGVAPTARGLFYLGLTYRALRDPEHARGAFHKALVGGFNDPYLYYVLIEQDRQAGEKQAGLEDFRAFYGKYPDSPWLHMLYGDAYSAKNDAAQAEAEYKHAVQIDPKLPVVHYQLGLIAFGRGDYQDAADDFHREIGIDPTFANAYLYLGTAMRRLGKNEDALPVLKEAVARDPNFPLAYRSLAVSEIDAGKLDAALQTLQVASQRFPEEAAFPAQMASLLTRMGRPREAARKSHEAEILSKKSNPVHSGSAGQEESLILGAPAEAQHGQGSDASPPDTPQTAVNSASEASPGTLRQPLGALDEARSSHENANLDSALLPAYECVKRSDAVCATKALAAVEPGARKTPDYLELEARTFTIKRQKEAALRDIAEAIRLAPREYRYLMAQGEIYQSFNDQPSAIRCFLEADRLHPHASETFYFLGMSFFFAEDYARAKKHFQEAWQLDPANDRAAFMLGISNIIDFKLAEAKPYFEAALKLNPNNPFCHLHYGILLSRSGDNDAALAELKTAERIDGSYALTHYNLGHLYNKEGDYVDARQELETAVKLKPSLAEAYYQLGTVYRRLGLQAESQAAYRKFEEASLTAKREVADPMESDLLPADHGK